VSLTAIVTLFSLAVTAYFTVFNTLQLAIAGMAAVYLWRDRRRRTLRDVALASRLSAPPLVSIVVPAFNEVLTIVESVQALLAVEYDAREIVVVNDGSSDDTLRVMTRAFHLVAAPVAFEQPLETAPVRGVYRSTMRPELVVVDKENAGTKADAANAGINVASGALILVIDADTVLEPRALSRAVLPFLEDPRTIAAGGYVAIGNGARVEAGRVTHLEMPQSWLARFQIVEYMRSFLMFRLACAAQNAVPLISGAFGLFRRDAVIDVGGFGRRAIGEDLDLTLRIQEYYRARRRPMRIAFVPTPVCWTQAPEDPISLRSQRYRWRRGLLQSLWRQRHMIANPRYGVVGLLVVPYMIIFEGLGPLVETAGYAITSLAAAGGFLYWRHYAVLLAVSLLFGAARTFVAVILSDLGTRRYMRSRDLGILFAAAILENFGYHQLNTWWSCVGTVQAIMGTGGWNDPQRLRCEPGVMVRV
jgi:cellulose synthase/poly-beta-1,6-N-acetylglucosamine synthase-like glycosyltransferase